MAGTSEALRAARSYEETALAGSLSDDQLDEIVAAFAGDSDVFAIAQKLDIPRDLVVKALDDGSIAERAMRVKRGAAVARFMGAAVDRLLGVIESPMTDPAAQIAAIKLTRDLLGLRPSEQPKTTKPGAKKTARKAGGLEAALNGLD